MPLTSSPWTVVAPALVVVLVCMAAPVTLLRRPDPLGHTEPRRLSRHVAAGSFALGSAVLAGAAAYWLHSDARTGYIGPLLGLAHLLVALVVWRLLASAHEARHALRTVHRQLEAEQIARREGDAESARRLAELERRAQDERAELEVIYSTAPIGLCVLDRELRWRRINRHLADINGLPPEAHIGRSVRELLPTVADQAEYILRRVIETGEPMQNVPIQGETPAGPGRARQWVEHFTPLRDTAGEVVGVNVVCQEITDQVNTELALREADRRKDEFLAMLAHELRNPLAPMRNGLEILHRVPGDSPIAARTRDMMGRQITHMVRLIDDLLDVSRIRQGKLSLQRRPVPVHEVIDAALEASQPLMDGAQHRLTVSLPDEPLVVDADPTRLAQVLSNLLNNAAKYTPDGGRIHLSADAQGDEVRVRIADNGVGIPPGMLPHVFDLFTQVGHHAQRAQGGLGIGLSLARRLVTLHGGCLNAESAGADQGSTFTITLPRVTHAARVAG